MSQLSDEEVVKQVSDGDLEKYGMIVEKYEKVLFRYIKRMINQSDEEVEDVVQETLISGYENINGFNLNQKFSSWIFRVAHNRCIDYFRKKRIKTTIIEDKEELIQANEKMIEELEIEKENKKKIQIEINKLELKYKEVIMLYFFEEKSYDEIADILHTTTSNVGVMLGRAKGKLKKLIITNER